MKSRHPCYAELHSHLLQSERCPYLAERAPFGVDHHLFRRLILHSGPLGHVLQILEVARIGTRSENDAHFAVAVDRTARHQCADRVVDQSHHLYFQTLCAERGHLTCTRSVSVPFVG